MTGMLTRNEQAVDEADGSGATDFGNYQLEVSRTTCSTTARLRRIHPSPSSLQPASPFSAGSILVGRSAATSSTTERPVHRPDPLELGSRRTAAAQGHGLHPHAVWPAPRPRGAGATSCDSSFAPRSSSSRRPRARRTDAPRSSWDVPPSTTLVIERTGYPHGVSMDRQLAPPVGRRGDPLRGPRPALRAFGGAWPLLLSFDSVADRDRAASELRDETGLGPDGRSPAVTGRAPAWA